MKKIILLALITTGILLSSCPEMIQPIHMQQAKDDRGPAIVITNPVEGTLYPKTVVVEGTVTDTAGDGSQTGEVKALSYEVIGTEESGDVLFDEAGSFSFRFSTTDMSGSIVIKILALDWNGNPGEESITLIDGAGDINNFHAEPENKQVTFSWDAVPLVEEYRLYYTTNGNLPTTVDSEVILNSTTTSCTIYTVKNGVLVTGFLTAATSNGDINMSDYARGIALSHNTLTPEVTGGYRQISLNWNSIDAGNQFNIYKSTSKNSGYTPIALNFTGTQFTDNNLVPGAGCFYKITPASDERIESYPAYGAASALAPLTDMVISSKSLMDSASDFAFDGRYLYIAANTAGVVAVDVSNPEYPVIAGSYNTAGNANAVALAGNYLYVADGAPGLVILDVSNPAALTLAGSVDTPGSAMEIAVSGSYAYLACLASGLRIVNISNPAAPVYLTGSFWDEGSVSVKDVAISGNYAFLAYDTSGVVSIDISNPAAIDANSDKAAWDNASGSSEKITIQGNYAYVAHGAGGLYIVDISNPGTVLTEVSSCVTAAAALGVSVNSRYAFMASSTAGVEVIDISTPAGINNSSGIYTVTEGNDNIKNLLVSNNLVFTADDYAGFFIIDFNIPEPALEKTINTSGEATRLFIEGNYAFVADGSGGLAVINTTDNTIRTCDTGGAARDVFVSGKYAYVADGNSGLVVVDISSPESVSNNSVVREINNTWTSNGLTKRGDYLLLANDTEGVYIIDVSVSGPSDSIDGSILGFCKNAVSNKAMDVAVKDNIAYVADGNAMGVYAFNFLNPLKVGNSSIIRVSSNYNNITGTAESIGFYGSYGLLADQGNNIQLVDLADSTSGTFTNLAGTTISESTGTAQDIFINSGYLFVADLDAGLEIYSLFDIATLDNGDLIASYDVGINTALGIITAGTKAYLAQGADGLMILDL